MRAGSRTRILQWVRPWIPTAHCDADDPHGRELRWWLHSFNRPLGRQVCGSTAEVTWRVQSAREPPTSHRSRSVAELLDLALIAQGLRRWAAVTLLVGGTEPAEVKEPPGVGDVADRRVLGVGRCQVLVGSFESHGSQVGHR